jgi:hypothetical protein
MSDKNISMEYSWSYSSIWPYNGMVNDLWRGIQAEENYLVALGLFAYSEALGRMILNTVGDGGRGEGLKAYRHFTEKFIRYSFNDVDWKTIFGSFRNGLAHQFFIKKSGSGVYNEDGTKACGIDVSGDGFHVYIHSYFLHFVRGLQRALDNGDLKVDDPVFTTTATSSSSPSVILRLGDDSGLST